MLDWALRRVGPRTLDTLRAVVPMPIKRQVSRSLVKNVKASDDIVTAKSGHRFVSISEPVFLQVLYEGEYERDLSNITRRLIKDGETVVDIGANFGWYSVLMAQAVGPDGQVFSFEPNATIHEVLKRNIELNDFSSRINLNKFGIGERAATGVLLSKSNESAIGYFSTADDPVPGDDGQSVEIHPLDEVVGAAIDNIAFVKIDVEGFEPFVLRGARKVLASDHPPVILMEINLEALERSHTDIDSFLTELGALGQPAIASGNGLTLLDGLRRENANVFFFPTKGRYSERLDQFR